MNGSNVGRLRLQQTAAAVANVARAATVLERCDTGPNPGGRRGARARLALLHLSLEE
jgi:hypothetical protein